MSAAMLVFMLVVAPAKVRTCDSSDVLPAGANFSSPALVVDLEGCTTLSLSSNTIGPSGAAAIAEALKNNTALTYLRLDSNSIGASGAAAIAEVLKGNTALTSLHLNSNNIGDIGAVAIVEALKSNTALTYLNLYNNNIGDSGAVAIAEALKINAAVTELRLTLDGTNMMCNNHGRGTLRIGTIDADGDRMIRSCKCSGSASAGALGQLSVCATPPLASYCLM